jgi:endonuclease/exonuclease/phosphatase family metal-dependent hydrolase
MNTEQFDRLAETLEAGVDRRRVFQGLAGAAAAFLGPGQVGAKPRRKGKLESASASRRPSVPLKVFTQNLYQGASLTPLLAVTSLEELVAAGAQVFAAVRATDFPERARVLAEAIEDAEPHLVGLQEVAWWRSQTPSDSNPAPNAQHTEYDFLAILLRELAKQGGRYKAVATVTNFDGEIPIAGRTGLQDLRFTDRDVILARTDLPRKELSVSNAQSAHFVTNLAAPSPVLGTITILHGWAAVDVTLRGGAVRFVNTHLEVLAPGVQVAQGNELLAGPLVTSLPAVLVGDLNSAADGSSTATYGNMLAAGFVDAWPQRRPAREGYTCCQAEDLRNKASTLTERVDLVLTRGEITAIQASRTGADARDKTSSGLWPSDHAGVSATLRLGRA